jgi:peptide/nickel transport system permease protein
MNVLWPRLDRPARIATTVLVTLVLVGVAGPWIAPFDPTVSGDLVAERLQPPSAAHWLGTDFASRDVLSRLLYGTRVSLLTAAIAVFLVLVVGVTWGMIAGLKPGAVDRMLMRIVDVVLSTPRLLIVLALVAFTERLSPVGLALILGFTSWPLVSRIVRTRVRELAVSDYVAGARALGLPFGAVLWRHVLPGTLPAVVAGVVTTVATVIPLEAALSYFGAGIAPPDPSWGVLLQDAGARPLDAWWLLLFPSAAIAATVMSVNVLGDRLTRRDRNLPVA